MIERTLKRLEGLATFEFFMVFQSCLKDFPKPVVENAAMGSCGHIGQSKEGSVMNRPSTVSVVSAEDRPIATFNQQIHENYQIDLNHQIYNGICLIWERRAVRLLPPVLARQNEETSEQPRQSRLPRSRSSAYSDGFQLGGVVAAARREEEANIRVIPRRRLAQGLHLLLHVQAARKEAALWHVRHENPMGRKIASGRAGTLEFEHKPIMTCRIERFVIEGNRVILCISGRIREQDVDLLRSLLEQERSVVAIDLKEVLLVDRRAVRLLALSESNGAELRNCPAYIREWVTRERVDGSASQQWTEESKEPADA